MFIVINNTSGEYFEMDFAGWSWQADKNLAHEFDTEKEAKDCIINLDLNAGVHKK